MYHPALQQTDISVLGPLRLHWGKAASDAGERPHGSQGGTGTEASQERDACLCLGTAGAERENKHKSEKEGRKYTR